jgi:hypothetical protein
MYIHYLTLSNHQKDSNQYFFIISVSIVVLVLVLVYHDGRAQNIDKMKPAQEKQGIKASGGVW